MQQRFNKSKYGQRWQAETVNSMLKRLLDSARRARQYWSQTREVILRVLTHNVMILWIGFLQSSPDPFSCLQLRDYAAERTVGHGIVEQVKVFAEAKPVAAVLA